MHTATIGYIREDGDLAILATLNNNDEHMDTVRFIELVEFMRMAFDAASDKEVIVLEREDAPDYVAI